MHAVYGNELTHPESKSLNANSLESLKNLEKQLEAPFKLHLRREADGSGRRQRL